jgi:hypothetical protein
MKAVDGDEVDLLVVCIPLMRDRWNVYPIGPTTGCTDASPTSSPRPGGAWA